VCENVCAYAFTELRLCVLKIWLKLHRSCARPNPSTRANMFGMHASMFIAILMVWPFTGSCVKSAFTSESTKNRPVSKVINVLKDMLKQLEKEATEDEEIYDKMACWCETNDKEKTKSIKDAESQISDLETKIDEFKATSSRLGSEIKNLETEVSDNQRALDQATGIREKQLSEFNAEEKDLVNSISSLKSAVQVLSKHQGGSLLQVPQSRMQGVAKAIQSAMKKHDFVLDGVLTHSQRRAIRSFLQAPEGYLDAEPTFKQSYAPQSGQIFGILDQMRESFEGNLATSQKEEMANQKAYEDLKIAKNDEIEAGQEQIEAKTQKLATTEDKLAHAKEDLDDTKVSLAADEEFLMKLKEKCSMTDSEWEERQKTRQMEMEAVSKAVSILSSDDAKDTFQNTFNPALFQKEGVAQNSRRSSASDLLSKAASKLDSPALAALAYRVRLDAFTKVKKAIDDMVTQLLKEKADEIKHRDFCIEEFNTNQMQMEKKQRKDAELKETQHDLEIQLKDLTSKIDTLKSEISEMQVQLKRAGQDREVQNKEFQATVAEQRQTKKLLHAALEVLEGFYGKQSFVQNGQEPAGPAPPPGFDEYKKNAASGGVMAMIQQIIDDTKAVESETIRSEEDAQAAYEDFVKETNASIKSKSKEIVNRSSEKATAESDLVETKEQLQSLKLDMEKLDQYRTELHSSCDFVMKNFDLRQEARDEELEALKQAKAILSGAKFSDFLQRR